MIKAYTRIVEVVAAMRPMGCGGDKTIIYRLLHAAREEWECPGENRRRRCRWRGATRVRQSVSRIERNFRIVTDCELKVLCAVLRPEPGALPDDTAP